MTTDAFYRRKMLKPRKYKRILAKYWFSYLLFLPTLLFMILLLWFPFLRGVWMSFHEWPFIGDPEFIGLGNYTYLIRWEPFHTSVKATAIFWTATIVQLGIALTAALIVKNITRFQNVISGSFLLPYTMPPVVTGTIWLYLLNPSLGPVWKYLVSWGVLDGPIYWNVQGDAALAVVTLITAWTFWPFMFLIIFASLQNIPTEHYETAKIYGANRFQSLIYVTLPQIKGALLVAVSIRTIWNLAKVSQPIQMTFGGPGYSTSILGVLLYRFAYNDGRFGIAYAVGMILLTITIGFVFLFLKEFQRQRGGSE